MKINYFSPQKYKFTEELCQIVPPPKILYSYAKNQALAKLADRRKVAIVGARKYTNYGEKIAYKAAYELARRGVVVISGLAYGIDSIAHRGALAAGGQTVAVLGTPLTKIYPAAHRQLAEQIVTKDGAIFSEYKEDTGKMKGVSFLERNRIISGLAELVLVVEAGERSGTLNTAMHALDQGKELWAVPGDINRANSLGCNRLIRQGATPLTEIDELIRWFFPNSEISEPKLEGDNEIESEILRLISQGLSDGEELMKSAKISPQEFSQVITLLEIKGRVRALGANNWATVA